MINKTYEDIWVWSYVTNYTYANIVNYRKYFRKITDYLDSKNIDYKFVKMDDKQAIVRHRRIFELIDGYNLQDSQHERNRYDKLIVDGDEILDLIEAGNYFDKE